MLCMFNRMSEGLGTREACRIFVFTPLVARKRNALHVCAAQHCKTQNTIVVAVLPSCGEG